MKYLIWVEGMKATTQRELEIPPYKDGSSPTIIKIKGIACKSGFFNWSDHKQIKYEKVPPKDSHEKATT